MDSAKKTRRLMALGLLHAYVPKPGLRLEFPLKALPTGSAGIVHFMVDRAGESCRRFDSLPANALISNLSINSSPQHLFSEPRGDSHVPTRSVHGTTKVKWMLTGVRALRFAFLATFHVKSKIY